jgi:hypothetical protein
MSILIKLETSYKKWKSEADIRAKRALEKAETKAEQDKIRARLAIESAKRKKAVVDAKIEQKEAEVSLKNAKKKLNEGSGGFNWFESMMNYGSKPKPKKAVIHHHKRLVKKVAIKTHKKTIKRKSNQHKDFSLVRMNGKMYKVYD